LGGLHQVDFHGHGEVSCKAIARECGWPAQRCWKMHKLRRASCCIAKECRLVRRVRRPQRHTPTEDILENQPEHFSQSLTWWEGAAPPIAGSLFPSPSCGIPPAPSPLCLFRRRAPLIFCRAGFLLWIKNHLGWGGFPPAAAQKTAGEGTAEGGESAL